MHKQKLTAAVKASLLMALTSHFTLIGYEIVRSISNTLFKEHYGVESLPTIMAGIPFVLLPILIIYGKCIQCFGPKKTLVYGHGLTFLVLLASTILYQFKVIGIVAFLYLFREVYAVCLVEQYWSFINSIITQEEAKKYNGLFLALSSLGAVFGGVIVHQWVKDFGILKLLYFSSFIMLPAMYLSLKAYKSVPKLRMPKTQKKKVAFDLLGLKPFKKDKVLFGLFAMVVAGQIYGVLLDLNFQGRLSEHYPNVIEQTSYSGLFFAILNSVSLIFQGVLTPILLKLFPVGIIHLFIPVVHFGMVLFTIIYPSLMSVSVALLLFKAMDYSIFRAAKEILYIPLSFEARFRAKEFIDVFGYRVSKGAFSFFLTTLQSSKIYLFGAFSYSILALVATIVWFFSFAPYLAHMAILKRKISTSPST